MKLLTIFLRIHCRIQISTFLTLLFSTVLLTTSLFSQNEYKGYRLALFDFSIIKVKNESVLLKCKVANTGVYESGVKNQSNPTIIELDSTNLPPVLWGHEEAIANAAINSNPRLKPGEISKYIWLQVEPNAPGPTVINSDFEGCSDLVIDTAFLTKFTERNLNLSVIISNQGNVPMLISGKKDKLGINGYFVSGNKLSRGAILAGKHFVAKDKESITGWLEPGERVLTSIQLDLQNRSIYSPNIYLELIAPPTQIECEVSNNYFFLPFQF